jgi:signal peptidase I
LRVAVVTGLLATLAGLTWFYLAPAEIGGHTAYIITHGISMEPLFHTGDLAIVRAASTYKIGQIVAYHSSLLHEVVLHRIVAIHAGRYTFKGDNNHFLDPVHPTHSELVGRLWIHLPHAGLVVERLRTPVGAAILAGAIGLVLIALEKDHVNNRLARKRARDVSGETHAVKPTDSEGSRAANLRDGLVVSGLAVVVFFALCLFAFERPSRVTGTRAVPYTQRAVFTYSAAVPRNTVYPSGRVSTGDPIFLRFVRRLDVKLHYHLLTRGTADVTGTSNIALRLSDSTGWSRTVQLSGRRSFVGRQFNSTAVIDLNSVQTLINHVAALTGIPSSDATVAIVANVHLSGNLAGAPARTTFSPTASFQLSGAQLLPTTTSGAAASTTQGVVDTQLSKVMVSSQRANPINLFGHSLSVRLIRLVAVGALALSTLAALVLLVLLVRLKRLAECEQIEAEYRHLIVPLGDGARFAGQEPIDLISMAALVKIAQHSGQLILHSQGGGADSYLVHDGDAIYRYRVGGSRSNDGDGTPEPPSGAPSANGTSSDLPAAAVVTHDDDGADNDEIADDEDHASGNARHDFEAMEVGAAGGIWSQRSEATPPPVASPPASAPPAPTPDVADTPAGGHDYGLYSVTRVSAVSRAELGQRVGTNGRNRTNGNGDYPDAMTSAGASLAVATSVLRRAIAARPYAATLDATGGTGPYRWAITSGTLPTGLTLDASTGVISGAPTGSGTMFFMASVTDSGPEARTATAQLSIHVAVAPPRTKIKHFKVNLKKRAVTFRFKAKGEVTGFECALVKAPTKKGAKSPRPKFEACEGPVSYRQLTLGRYIFYVRAVGPGGPDPKPAKHKFRIS